MAKADDPYFRLRVPEGLKSRIEAAADENHRSMTAEILARLEASFDAPGEHFIKMTKDEMFQMVQDVVRMTEGGGISTDKKLRKKIVEWRESGADEGESE